MDYGTTGSQALPKYRGGSIILLPLASTDHQHHACPNYCSLRDEQNVHVPIDHMETKLKRQ